MPKPPKPTTTRRIVANNFCAGQLATDTQRVLSGNEDVLKVLIWKRHKPWLCWPTGAASWYRGMSPNRQAFFLIVILLGLEASAACGYETRGYPLRRVASAGRDTVSAVFEIEEDRWDDSGLKVEFPCRYAPEDHEYFPEKPEFWFSIRGPKPTISRPGSPWMASGVYQGFFRRVVGNFSSCDYHFHSPVVGRACTLSVSPQTSEVLNLAVGATYDLVSYSHGLLVLQGGRIVFHGHTDYQVDQACVPANLSPVSFAQTRVLKDHYRTCIDVWPKFTNTEITFRLYGQSVALHQGQSGSVAGYDIRVLVARVIEYPEKCCDCGECAISFMITKSERHRR